MAKVAIICVTEADQSWGSLIDELLKKGDSDSKVFADVREAKEWLGGSYVAIFISIHLYSYAAVLAVNDRIRVIVATAGSLPTPPVVLPKDFLTDQLVLARLTAA